MSATVERDVLAAARLGRVWRARGGVDLWEIRSPAGPWRPAATSDVTEEVRALRGHRLVAELGGGRLVTTLRGDRALGKRGAS